jgi:beta-mannosidase
LKRVSLPQPEIKGKVSFDGKKIVVTLVSKNFAKDVTLSAPGFKGRFSDNFFDMIPDKRYEVSFLTDGGVNVGLFEEALRIKSLRDSY